MASSLESSERKPSMKSRATKTRSLRSLEVVFLYVYAAGFVLAVVYKSVNLSAGLFLNSSSFIISLHLDYPMNHLWTYTLWNAWSTITGENDLLPGREQKKTTKSYGKETKMGQLISAYSTKDDYVLLTLYNAYYLLLSVVNANRNEIYP